MFAFLLISGASHIDIMIASTGVTSYDSDIEIPVVETEVDPLLEYEMDEMPGRKVFLSEAQKTTISHVNQRFPVGVTGFRIMLGRYAVVIGFDVRYKKKDYIRVTAYCAKKD